MDTTVSTIEAPESDSADAARGVEHHWPLRALTYFLMFVVLAPIGSGFVVTAFGKQTYHWRAFDVQVGIQPWSRGETRLIFSPLGEVRARTHVTPMSLNIELRNIAFEDLRRLIVKPPPRHEIEQDFTITAK